MNNQKPDLPQNPIYRGCLLPQIRGKSGFYWLLYDYTNIKL